MVLRHEVRRGAYADSIVLMQLQSALAGLPGILDAGVVMATEANLDLLRANDLLPEDIGALAADDLLLVVKSKSESSAGEALSEVDRLMERPAADGGADAGEDFRPKSLRGALRLLPEAGWVLVSTPGRYAAGVAEEAIESGRNVFLYSDNVAIEEEVRLKKAAHEKGLLVMGPDCGTAVVNRVGLGFANRVRRGPVGIVAAAGTGLQTVASRVHELGSGISHALGTGGRDLSAEVGGTTAIQALNVLARDEETGVVVLISKPPAAAVAARVLAVAQEVGKPVIVTFSGLTPPVERVGNVRFARSLDEASRFAVESSKTASSAGEPRASVERLSGYLRGLFSGGTLALEALHGVQVFLDPLFSNLSSAGVEALADVGTSRAHTILDLGADEFTVGRLHPMIDPDLRNRRLRQEAADEEVGLILLDVVLGEGAHGDPASELAPVVREALERKDLEITALVVGTSEDPQNLEAQVSTLKEAGALVFRTTEEVIAHVAERLRPEVRALEPAVSAETLAEPLAAINIGLEMFYTSLVGQDARVVQVDWRPPAGGNEALAAILAKMKS